MPVCSCGRALSDTDRMGTAAYFCPACKKTVRPEEEARKSAPQAHAEGQGDDPVRAWVFARNLLLGGCIGLPLLGIGVVALAAALGGDDITVAKAAATVGGLAIAALTAYAEAARRRARKAQGKDPKQLF
jgi:hypothetical protein